jgi:ADP-ribose pyrophosphatase YjhB (NUDIX family)
LAGRGKLYQWGPNHAADPIVTRTSKRHSEELEVVVIRRGDTGSWALPGGMVDPGEGPEDTLKREFHEEAMGSGSDGADKDKIKRLAEKVFSAPGTLVYQGYIDDPRNTDHAWIESFGMHYHLSDELAQELTPHLKAGDDASEVKWLLASEDEPDFKKLYGSHRPIVERTVRMWKQGRK